MTLRAEHVAVGTELPARTVTVTRADLVRYAGASEDFNPVHWNPRVAREAGMPDVIAHGMLTMAVAARTVTDWVRDPGAIVEYRTRFSSPVVVPDDEHGAYLEVRGRVGALLDGGRVRVDLTVTSGGVKVLGEARAVVQLGLPGQPEAPAEPGEHSR
ncbi:MaoC family dehydratase [Yinghuangia soli]|uniref:MaoC family dehydratase n=1 Tax=Yinghuangia soli TaxID=2908204 RepID=A0AA41Q1Q6_9ACTN|nr:MaoC family dehydratase [Yinghuangia soli]MCF2528834.1 MaoC family dehydratase [Yinghuangia soli]